MRRDRASRGPVSSDPSSFYLPFSVGPEGRALPQVGTHQPAPPSAFPPLPAPPHHSAAGSIRAARPQHRPDVRGKGAGHESGGHFYGLRPNPPPHLRRVPNRAQAGRQVPDQRIRSSSPTRSPSTWFAQVRHPLRPDPERPEAAGRPAGAGLRRPPRLLQVLLPGTGGTGGPHLSRRVRNVSGGRSGSRPTRDGGRRRPACRLRSACRLLPLQILIPAWPVGRLTPRAASPLISSAASSAPIVPIFSRGDYDAQIRRARGTLRGGGSSSCPTETVYGAAGALNQSGAATAPDRPPRRRPRPAVHRPPRPPRRRRPVPRRRQRIRPAADAQVLARPGRAGLRRPGRRRAEVAANFSVAESRPLRAAGRSRSAAPITSSPPT